MVARATVIIPTFGQAKFAVWPIKSVQAQTVRDIEICIICDGSPEKMVDFFNALAKEDSRIRVFSFPKGPRTGEAHRDVVIRRETQGRIICYCAHDDLWLPDHIEEIEKSLSSCCFTHTIHANVNTPERINEGGDLFCNVGYINLGNNYFVDKMLTGSISLFGLTNGAHTRESYLALKEGWTTTPQVKCGILLEDKPIWFPTDLYMWNKFLRSYRGQCKTHAKLTAIHFPISDTPRREWPETQRYEELKLYFKKIQDPVFLEKIREIVRDFYQREHKLELVAEIQQAEAKAQQAEAKAQQAEAKAQQAEAKAQQAETMAQQAEARATEAEAKAQQAATWFFKRGLKPTRTDVVAAYRYILGREPENESVILEHMRKKTVGKLISSFMGSEEFRLRMNQTAPLLLSFVQNRPEFKAKIKKWIQQIPAIEKRRGKMALNRSLMTKQTQETTCTPPISTDLSHLTPRARQIYVDLKATITRCQKENG